MDQIEEAVKAKVEHEALNKRFKVTTRSRKDGRGFHQTRGQKVTYDAGYIVKTPMS